jgi:hypothetical protein
MANEPTSMPMISRIDWPTNKNISINKNETAVAFSACICPAFLRTSINTGIEPIISITANNIMVTVSVSFRLNIMLQAALNFQQRKNKYSNYYTICID